MSKIKVAEVVAYEPIVKAVDDTALETLDFRAQNYAERLSENTVASMDDSMQTFDFANNPYNNNMKWAERRGYQAELAAYDADYHMRSPACLPKDSPDRPTQDILVAVKPVIAK